MPDILEHPPRGAAPPSRGVRDDGPPPRRQRAPALPRGAEAALREFGRGAGPEIRAIRDRFGVDSVPEIMQPANRDLTGPAARLTLEQRITRMRRWGLPETMILDDLYEHQHRNSRDATAPGTRTRRGSTPPASSSPTPRPLRRPRAAAAVCGARRDEVARSLAARRSGFRSIPLRSADRSRPKSTSAQCGLLGVLGQVALEQSPPPLAPRLLDLALELPQLALLGDP